MLVFIFQMAVIYLPELQGFFHTQPLSADELVICLAFSILVFVGIDINKMINYIR
jgi:P-type Ca2+ transporter type 2C